MRALYTYTAFRKGLKKRLRELSTLDTSVTVYVNASVGEGVQPHRMSRQQEGLRHQKGSSLMSNVPVSQPMS